MTPIGTHIHLQVAMSAFEQLGRFVAGYNARSASPALQQALRLHVADTVGAWIAAAGTGEGQALIGFHAATRPSAGSEGVGAPADDVALSCALARLSEIDDIHLAAMTTAGGIVIPAALTIAASQQQADGAEIAAAIVAGYEVMIRIGTAIDGPTVLYRGIWPTYFAAPCGVAAVAARLMKLDAQKTAHALALASSLAAPGVGHHNAPTTSRWFAVGNAAHAGVAAARAAQAGFTADVHLLDSGFLKNVYGISPDLAVLLDRLGESLALADVSFKPWCAARQTMAATQAFKDIIESGVAVDDIEAVEVSVLPPHLKMLDHGVIPGDRASYLTSVPYQLAAAALMPEALFQVGYADEHSSAALQGLMRRIKVGTDPDLLSGYPAAWPTLVIVSTHNGKHERRVTHVPGDPARPLGEGDLAEKFARFVAPIVGKDRTARLWAMALDGLDGHAAVNRLVREIARICAAAAAR
jgi:2-methylcitrate dehydratase PrpD